MSRVSIIIPARNDATALRATLDHLDRLPGVAEAEVIVAASGDREGTTGAVAGRARLLWPDGSTRARLMNAGAAAARGEILFFLHADCVPPADALRLINQALRDERAVGGAFEHAFVELDWRLHLISCLDRVRYRLTRNYYGDQGLFVRAEVFQRLGGYRDLGLMEDLDFSRRLKRVGRTTLIHRPVLSSGRRFLARGPWRTLCGIGWLLLLYTVGFNTERYADWWRRRDDRPPGSPWGAQPREPGQTASGRARV